VLADDSALFRQGVAALLTDAGHDVVAQAGDAAIAVAAVDALSPDLVVLDIRMPPTHTTEGLLAAIELREQRPDVGVLLLSQYVETTHAVRLLSASSRRVGYLLKDRVSDLRELTDAMERIDGGGTVIDPEVVSVLLGHRERAGRLDRLTDRERDVLRLMAEGRSNSAIAAALHLGHKTIETHVGNVFAKLDIHAAPHDHRRVLAVLAYLRA
jgi:DNA-binding NarL/FixJ family response regulator